MEKVAVTGMGTLNAIASSLEQYLENLKNMRVGIDWIEQFDAAEYPAAIAAEIKDFDPSAHLDPKMARRYDRFLQLAVVAARQAVADAGLSESQQWREDAAVTVSSGIGGFKTLHREYQNLFSRGPKAVRPFLIPMMIADMASGAVALDLQLKGPNFSVISACASSLHSLIVSAMMVQAGTVDFALAGGSEAVIDPMPVAAFGNMTALSPRRDAPKEACRPFDTHRDGFVMGEGAGVLVLESERSALARGARIYGWIEGWGMSEDAFHISQTDPEGRGAAKAMLQALGSANCAPSDIDLVNCHATSTPVGDVSEIRALRKVFGDALPQIPLQSTKALLGHTLGAAGAVELIAGILQLRNGFVHGMPNLDTPDPECEGLYLPRTTEKLQGTRLLKNAFGFGGHNACVLFRANPNGWEGAR